MSKNAHEANPNPSRMALHAYVREIWNNKKWALPGLVLPGIASVFTTYIPPLVIGIMIRHFNGKIPSSLQEITPYVGWLTASWLFGEVIWRIGFLTLNRADAQGMRNLYVNALEELLKKDMGFFNDNFAGSLTKKATGYGRNFEGFMDTLSFNVLGNLLPLIFALVILWLIAPIMVFALVAILAVTTALVLPQVRKRQHLVAVREASSNKMAGHVADVIGNISAVHAFAHEAHEQTQHIKLAEILRTDSLRAWDYHVTHIDTIVAPFNILANVVGLLLAITVTDNAATMAAIFVSFNYFVQATRVLFEFNRIYRNIENALTDAGQFTELLIKDPLLTELPHAKTLQITHGDIEFKHVDFAYSDASESLLFDDFNLHILPGEKVALVGHSGGGKTTVTKLLLRFIDIASGQILIDGQEIKHGTFRSLRGNIAYVPQDPAMFHRSILENIRYGKLDADDNAVTAAAQSAHALEFIEKLPHGFETLVGERGVKLSGGQRQRIAIARAMVKDAPILVLDEATSALDSESEVLIQDALWKLMEGRTAIVIAHRLSTIQKMDRIIVLSEGKIAEEGSHKELLQADGIYARLWAHQSGGFIEE